MVVDQRARKADFVGAVMGSSVGRPIGQVLRTRHGSFSFTCVVVLGLLRCLEGIEIQTERVTKEWPKWCSRLSVLSRDVVSRCQEERTGSNFELAPGERLRYNPGTRADDPAFRYRHAGSVTAIQTKDKKINVMSDDLDTGH